MVLFRNKKIDMYAYLSFLGSWVKTNTNRTPGLRVLTLYIQETPKWVLLQTPKIQIRSALFAEVKQGSGTEVHLN